MFNSEYNSSRLLSLDVFRGISIALMILVNSPTNYTWLNHSDWNGCTLADLVFPFFLFIMGASLAFSLSKSLREKLSFNHLLIKIIKRTIIIFLIGLFINAFPFHFHFATIRVFGVLQRIAICYFCAALLFLTTRLQTQAFIVIGLLIGYWVLMTKIPVPKYGVDNLTQTGNLAAYIDRLIFSSAHLYEKVFDPEGFLSTFPAIATTLIGNLTGAWLLTQNNLQKKFYGIIIAGIIPSICGWFWGLSFPINKDLWTSSYVLWTSGLALLLLGLCYWLIEIKELKKWSKPFEIFGLNALAVYFLHVFFLKIQASIHVTDTNGARENLRIFITDHFFGSISLQNAALFYAISYFFIWLLVMTIFYRNKLFIKI